MDSQTINLNKEQIEKAIPRVEKGLKQYKWLQIEFKKRNVSENREFQKAFNAYYRVRRNSKWQTEFYNLLEINKFKNPYFEDILSDLYQKTGRMEASFVSKLIATINPDMPVIDKIVFNNLNLKLPQTNTENRSSIINEKYRILNKKFTEYLETENGKYLIKKFTEKYLESDITKVKMLDFVLWQTRS